MASEIRTIIADDESLGRKKLRILLAAEPGIHVVAECPDGPKTIAALRDYEPDLLLLDIQMPGSDGFEVLESVPADRLPVVIFTRVITDFVHPSLRCPRCPAVAFRQLF